MPEKGVNNRFKQAGNNLLIKFPLIAMEFDTKKNYITPDKVYPYSNKKYWFNCPKGHSYYTVLASTLVARCSLARRLPVKAMSKYVAALDATGEVCPLASLARKQLGGEAISCLTSLRLFPTHKSPDSMITVDK